MALGYKVCMMASLRPPLLQNKLFTFLFDPSLLRAKTTSHAVPPVVGRQVSSGSPFPKGAALWGSRLMWGGFPLRKSALGDPKSCYSPPHPIIWLRNQRQWGFSLPGLPLLLGILAFPQILAWQFSSHVGFFVCFFFMIFFFKIYFLHTANNILVFSRRVSLNNLVCHY